jgi:hypothetical protein
MSDVQAAIDQLRASPKSVRCMELCRLLKRLHFEVRNGAGPGHRVFAHPRIKSFHGSNFNCGHGKDPIVLPVYVRRIADVLEEWKAEIEEFMND